MARDDADVLARLQAVLTALLKHQLSRSLELVEGALDRWRRGDLGPFEAHAEILKHAVRSERLANRIAKVTPATADSVLRDAFDAEIVSRDEFVAMVGRQPEEVEPSAAPEEGPGPRLPDKRFFVAELMEEGAVLLHVDARCAGVVVPEQYRQDPKLVLRFGRKLVPAIADLQIGEEGVSGTLTFVGKPFHCHLPWSTIYAAVSEADQRAMVWPDDVPEVVFEHVQGAVKESRLEAVPRISAPEEARGDKGPRPRAGHLKLVD